MDNEAEQQRLETEMQKRRERIEKWRAEKKARDMGLIPGNATVAVVEKKEATPIPKSVKKWNLSDDEEDDDADDEGGEGEPPSKVKKEGSKNGGETKPGKKVESEDEVDPLDAYMMGIQKEVKNIGAKRKPIVIKGGVEKAETDKTEVDKMEVDKMEVDTPVVKVEASEKEDMSDQKPATDEKGENGELKPLMDIKRSKKVVTIISGVAVKKADAKKKGMLMEQNQDALEYSSEEEEVGE